LRDLLDFLKTLFHGVEIGEHQLGVDHLDVPDRIDRSRDVMHVGIFEAPHHLHDRIDLADVAEKFVTEPFASRRPLHQPRDIDEFNRCGNKHGGLGDLGEHLQA